MVDLREIVFSNLEDARINGAFRVDGSLYGASAEEIADDMVALAADCEDRSAEELLPYIREWLAKPKAETQRD